MNAPLQSSTEARTDTIGMDGSLNFPSFLSTVAVGCDDNNKRSDSQTNEHDRPEGIKVMNMSVECFNEAIQKGSIPKDFALLKGKPFTFPARPKDHRTWWQKHLPLCVGGLPDPTKPYTKVIKANIRELAYLNGVHPRTVYWRLFIGRSIHDALTP